MTAEVRALLRAEGPAAAAARFLSAVGPAFGPIPDTTDPAVLAMRARQAANAPIMLEHELVPFTGYLPDTAALRTDRLTLAVGRDTGDLLPARPAREIARRIGVRPIEFPGAHNGMLTQ